MSHRLGFAGLGIMGGGMASNLQAKGHRLTVWNRTRSKAEAIEGAEVANSLEDLARAVDIVFICVSDSPDVVDVVEALLPGLHDGH